MVSFVLNSILLGVGLAMDAFSVSIANGLNEPGMRRGRECLIAGTYGFFQFLMPVVGWFCVHMLLQAFRTFEKFIPWIALILLLYIGGKMILDAVRPDEDAADTAPLPGNGADGAPQSDKIAPLSGSTVPPQSDSTEPPQSSSANRSDGEQARTDTTVLTWPVLLLQGIATSIDALSVGFAIARYSWVSALVCAVIIACVTFVICMGGLTAGRKLSARLAGKAGILGGCILIFIGLEIFIRGVFL